MCADLQGIQINGVIQRCFSKLYENNLQYLSSQANEDSVSEEISHIA